jgi:hypothetical protein
VSLTGVLFNRLWSKNKFLTCVKSSISRPELKHSRLRRARNHFSLACGGPKLKNSRLQRAKAQTFSPAAGQSSKILACGGPDLKNSRLRRVKLIFTPLPYRDSPSRGVGEPSHATRSSFISRAFQTTVVFFNRVLSHS